MILKVYVRVNINEKCASFKSNSGQKLQKDGAKMGVPRVTTGFHNRKSEFQLFSASAVVWKRLDLNRVKFG